MLMTEYLTAWVQTTLHRRGVNVYSDRGAVSTEMAVVIGLVVGAAVIIMALLLLKARSLAGDVPDHVPAPT